MMSTVFPIAVESEKSIAPAHVSDEGKVGESSFAENLKESVGISGQIWEGAPGIELKKPTPQIAEDGSNKTPSSVTDTRDDLAAIQKQTIQTETKSSIAANKNELKEIAVHDLQVAGTIEGEPAESIDQPPGADPKDDAGKVLSSTAAELASVPNRTNITQNSEPVSRVREAGVPKEAMSVGKPQENVSSKKPVKTEVGQTLQPRVMNTTGSHSTIDGAKPNQQIVINDPVAGEVQIPTAAPGAHSLGIAPMNGGRLALVASSGDTSAIPAAMAKTVAQQDGTSRSDLTRDKGAPALDGQVTLAAPEDKTSSSKSDQKLGELSVAAVDHGNNSDMNSQPGMAATSATVHSIMPIAPVFHGASPGVAAASETGGIKQTGGADISRNPSTGHEQEGSSLVGGSAGAMPRMLTATPTTLEVGIQNGTHGWLKVRAEMSDGGVVNAAVSASSSTGQEMLHRELSSLANYLSAEKVAVNVVVTHSTAPAGDRSAGAPGMDGGDGQTSQRSNQEGDRRQSFSRTDPDGNEESTDYQGLQRADEDRALPLAIRAGGGSWLSVRA